MTALVSRPIKDYALGIYDGPHATPAEASEGAVFLGIKNLTDDGRLDFTEIRFVSEQELPRWTRRVTPQAGDVVFTYEATLHRYALIPEGFRGCLGRRVALVRPDPARVDSRFLLYFFLAPQWRAVVQSSVITGATVDRVPLEKFPVFPAALPPKREQVRIANVLSSYDDLIENNRRRMALLEDAARQLYQEWFVRLRFPGREHTPIVGGAPRGWQRCTLGDCSTFLSGGTPSKARADFWEGDIPWVSSGELTALRIDDASLHVSEEGVEAGSRLVPPKTILAVVRGMSLAKEFRLAMTSKTVCFNQDLKAIVAADGVDADFLFHTLVAQRDAIRDRASEASHGTKKLDTPVLASTPILLPASGIQRAFSDFVTPVNAQWDNLNRQTKSLRLARDLLLPRLMSGEVAL